MRDESKYVMSPRTSMRGEPLQMLPKITLLGEKKEISPGVDFWPPRNKEEKTNDAVPKSK